MSNQGAVKKAREAEQVKNTVGGRKSQRERTEVQTEYIEEAWKPRERLHKGERLDSLGRVTFPIFGQQ